MHWNAVFVNIGVKKTSENKSICLFKYTLSIIKSLKDFLYLVPHEKKLVLIINESLLFSKTFNSPRAFDLPYTLIGQVNSCSVIKLLMPSNKWSVEIWIK